MLAEFKTMPGFPVGAKEAFKAAKTEIFNDAPSYIDCSAPMQAYSKKLVADQKPFTDISVAKANQTNPAAAAAANDFSDLNSPEMQAKIAKMSPEEQMKFAMELQARIAQNKNVQTINKVNKPSPLTALSLKLSSSSQALLATLAADFNEASFPGYNKCQGLCKETDPTCAKRVSACENKISHDFFNSEIVRYAAFIKETQAAYEARKAAFEADLATFDAQAAKYPKEEIASDYTGAFVMLGNIANRIKEYEKAGALLIIHAKNNPYCKNDY
jgi:hypothetical protein